ncbi:MAG: DUF21 domain-containing protein [Acidimicrobiia bacterium]|nr:DUF21 domain-containing protein [Acidimicrobiia bacterium]
MSPLVALLVGVVLLAANAFFVAAEFALLASRRSRIEQLAAEGSRGARSAQRALRELTVMLAGAQLGITMASLGLGAVAEPAVAHLFEGVLDRVGAPSGVVHAVAFVIALAIVVFLHMVVGEMAPKSWAITHPERSAVLLAPPFRGFAQLFRPVLRALNGVSNLLVRACGVTPQGERAMAHAPADLALLLEESADVGTITSTEMALLSRALHLSGLDAGSAMTARAEVDAVGAGTGIAEVELVAARSGRSRLLVHDGGLDEPCGVLHVRDTLALEDAERARLTARDLAYALISVAPGAPLEDLLLEMRTAHLQFAVVVEAGELRGVVTMQDVLERLIGGPEEG